jgi:hypothetical protein
MANPDSKETLKITAEDLEAVSLPDAAVGGPISPALPGARSYGSISDASDQMPEVAEEKASILLQGWFYLGLAGLVGSLLGWAICEPTHSDGEGVHRWGNYLMLPLLTMFMCVGFGVAESVVERSSKKALIRGALAIPLGLGLGGIFYFVANIIYNIGLAFCSAAGVQSYRNPAVWLARGIAWMVFGLAGGVIYGIVGQSSKKAKFGILGGIIGAGLGGLLFDPIAMLTGKGGPSRAVGFALFGLATGIAMGLVESALKDRWLYVTAGPLAGKQFILYKAQTVIGSLQQSDVYLFKDPSIQPQHAVLELYGAKVQLRAAGPVFVAGQPTRSRVLTDGDLIQIGRYSFRYKERHRS